MMLKRIALPGALFFGYYTALGAYLPFINLYYERMGFNGIQIGVLASIPVLISSSTVMLWSGVADRFRWHNRILRINLLLCALSVFLLSTARSYQALIPWIALYAFFNSPLTPLLDNAALDALPNSRYSYGQLRLWGSIGWSISTVLVGTLIQRYAIQWFFYCYIAFMILTFVFSLFLPVKQPKLRTSLRSGLKNLVLHLPFILFLVSIFLISMTLGAAAAFLSIYLDGIGTSDGGIGWAFAISSLSEVPIMLYSAAIVRKIGARGLLKISFTTLILRWFLLSMIRLPLLALIAQGLHGITYGGFIVGSVTFINNRAPEGVRASAMAIFNLVTMGAGSIVGSLVGGFVYEFGGMPWLFRLLSLVAAAGLGFFLLSQRTASLEMPGIEEQGW